MDQGLVGKQASTVDGRGVVLNLTPQGRQTWRRVKALVQHRNEEIVACLDASEREQLDRPVSHAARALGPSDEAQ